jgi:cytochrome c peroxidase
MGGTDIIKTSIGDKWQQGPINSPTVLNSSLNVAQFWDGRAADLKEQAGGPIANPGEMAFTHTLAVDVLWSIPNTCASSSRCSARTTSSIDQVTAAIAEFEKTLVTPNSRFDQWLLGKDDALTPGRAGRLSAVQEQRLRRLPQWRGVGGNSFQKMGVVEPYKANSPKSRAASASPARTPTASTSRCPPCATSP